MQVTDIHQIKAALRDQALIGTPSVRCPMGRVVAVRRRKGQLLTMIRGWGVRWYAVESVTIEMERFHRRRRERAKMLAGNLPITRKLG